MFDYIAIPRDEFYILLDKLKRNKLTIEDLTQFDIITNNDELIDKKHEFELREQDRIERRIIEYHSTSATTTH